MSYSSLSALEAAQDDAIAAARRRVVHAEESLANYRSEVTMMQETAHRLASNQGIADHPGFRTAFARISNEIEENLRAGGDAVAELEQDVDTLMLKHLDEREQFLR